MLPETVGVQTVLDDGVFSPDYSLSDPSSPFYSSLFHLLFEKDPGLLEEPEFGFWFEPEEFGCELPEPEVGCPLEVSGEVYYPFSISGELSGEFEGLLVKGLLLLGVLGEVPFGRLPEGVLASGELGLEISVPSVLGVGLLISSPLLPITPVANRIPTIKQARASKPRRAKRSGAHLLFWLFYVVAVAAGWAT